MTDKRIVLNNFELNKKQYMAFNFLFYKMCGMQVYLAHCSQHVYSFIATNVLGHISIRFLHQGTDFLYFAKQYYLSQIGYYL